MLIGIALALLALAVLAYRRHRVHALLEECIARQALHEAEYPHHGGGTTGLRVETITRRWTKKLRAAHYRVPRNARARVAEALCLPRG